MTTREQTEFLELFNACKQKAVAVMKAAPEIIAKIEQARQQLYLANAQAQQQAKNQQQTTVQAAMVTDHTMTPPPPQAQTSLDRLTEKQTRMNAELAKTHLEITFLTGKMPSKAIQAALEKNLKSLNHLNQAVAELARLQGNLADPKQAHALETKIDAVLKSNAELKKELQKELQNLKSREIGATVDTGAKRKRDPEPESDSVTKRRRL